MKTWFPRWVGRTLLLVFTKFFIYKCFLVSVNILTGFPVIENHSVFLYPVLKSVDGNRSKEIFSNILNFVYIGKFIDRNTKMLFIIFFKFTECMYTPGLKGKAEVSLWELIISYHVGPWLELSSLVCWQVLDLLNSLTDCLFLPNQHKLGSFGRTQRTWIEKVLKSGWPIGKSVDIFLFNNLCGMA